MPEQHSGKRGQSMDYKLVISEHADELLDNLHLNINDLSKVLGD